MKWLCYLKHAWVYCPNSRLRHCVRCKRQQILMGQEGYGSEWVNE